MWLCSHKTLFTKIGGDREIWSMGHKQTVLSRLENNSVILLCFYNPPRKTLPMHIHHTLPYPPQFETGSDTHRDATWQLSLSQEWAKHSVIVEGLWNWNRSYQLCDLTHNTWSLWASHFIVVKMSVIQSDFTGPCEDSVLCQAPIPVLSMHQAPSNS